MDYRKEYEEALERAKQLSKELTVDDIVEQIFPELAESENKDEKIRKAILEHIQLCTESIPDRDKFIAWLEKQGIKSQGKPALEAIHEQKVDNANKVEPPSFDEAQGTQIVSQSKEPNDTFCKKNCKGYQDTGKCFSDGDCEAEIKGMENVRQELLEHCYKQAEMYDNLITGNEYRKIQSWIDWLKKQGERNDYKYSPLYIRFGDIPQEEKSTIYCGEKKIGCENGVSVYPAFIDINGNIVCGLTLPITKTTLYTQQHLFEYDNRPCYLVVGDYVGKGSDGEPLINNVKILRRITEYRVKGLKNESENNGKERGISPNWSEEDEHRLNDTIYFLDTAKKHYASTEELDACIEWLKSLKQRAAWKPSNEQIKALNEAVGIVGLFTPRGSYLKSLSEQLKKL